jgi:hypothetical protein
MFSWIPSRREAFLKLMFQFEERKMRVPMKFLLGTSISLMCGEACRGQADNMKTLNLLRDAQLRNEAAFPAAAVDAVVADSREKRSAKLHAEWIGDRYFVDAQCQEELRKADGGIVLQSSRKIVIGSPAEWMYYEPDHGHLLQRVSDNSMSCWPILKIRPRDMWFMAIPATGARTWAGLLEFQMTPKPDVTLELITNPSGEITVVSRRAGESEFSAVYSMGQGGNVLRYHRLSKSLPNFRGEYRWEAVDPERWRLASFNYWSHAPESEKLPPPDIELKITRFIPEPNIAPDRFLVTSLQLPAGTRVEEYGANRRRYRLGPDQQEEAGVSEEAYKSLADELLSSGFAVEKP